MGSKVRTKAVILASSLDTVALALGEHYSKLVFPMADGKRLLDHLFKSIQGSGICEVAVVAPQHVLDDSTVKNILNRGSDSGLSAMGVADDGLSGTAGILLKLRKFIGSCSFLVVGTDVLLDGMDLPAILESHRKRRASATVVLEEGRSDKRGAENVQVTAEGVVKQFYIPHHSQDLRRPMRGTGVYVFEPGVLEEVYADMYMDIKEQLIPELNESGVLVFAYKLAGPLCRLESIDEYQWINRQALLGATRIDGLTRGSSSGPAGHIWMGKNVQVSDRAYVLGPVVIGDGCVIEDGAQIIGPTTICSGTHVGRNALVRDSMVWSGCRLDSGSSIERSIVAEGCTVPKNTLVASAVVVADDRRSAGMRVLSVLRPTDTQAPLVQANDLRTSKGRQIVRVAHNFCGRIVDIVVSALAMLLFLPVFGVIAATIKKESPGPVFFLQRRCGRNGEEFNMYKFRTMVANAEAVRDDMMHQNEVDGPMLKMAQDPRVTRVGKLLRKTSLDELPQLFNVLKGDMRLVGPRPLPMDEMKFCPRWRNSRLKVRPGLTGLWQVHARDSHRFRDWIRYDLDYVRSRSTWLDLRILAKTAKSLVRR